MRGRIFAWCFGNRRRTVRTIALGVIVVVFCFPVWNVGRLRPDDVNMHRADLTCYTTAGRAMYAGDDPYAVTNPRGWHYLYPPLLGMALAPLGYLLPGAQAIIWYVCNVIFMFGMAVEMFKIRRGLRAEAARDGAHLPRRRDEKWLAILAWLAVLWPIGDTMLRGQVNLLLAYSLMLGLRLVVVPTRPWHRFAGGVVVALPAAIKLTPLAPACVLAGAYLVKPIVTKGKASWASAVKPGAGLLVGLIAFLFVIPAAVLGWQFNLDCLASVADYAERTSQVGANERVVSVRNQSLASSMYLIRNWTHPVQRDPNVWPLRWYPDPPVDEFMVYARAVLTVLMLGAAWALVRRWRAVNVSAAFGLACAFALVVSPISWGHHFVTLLPAALFVPGWALYSGRRRLALTLVATLAALILAFYFVLDWDWIIWPHMEPLRPLAGMTGVGLTVWFTAACTAVLVLGGARGVHDDR